jgi:hypothetical protein
MRSDLYQTRTEKALNSADFKAFGAAGQIRLHFFSRAGEREKKSRSRPVFELGDESHIGGFRT